MRIFGREINLQKRSSATPDPYSGQDFFRNMFGSIFSGGYLAGNSPDFIPADNNGGTIQLKGDGAMWLGLQNTSMQYWAYNYCAPLASVIDRLADADINGQLEVLKTDGTEDYSNSPRAKRIITLLNKPNPIQTWEEFRGQQVIYKKIFGFCPVFAMTPSGMDKSYTTHLWNLNPFYARPIQNTNFSLLNGQNSIISEWQISIFNKSYSIPAEKVFVLKDGYLDANTNNCMLPLSKIAGLDYAISNICAAMEADNVLLRKKGPLGFISHAPTTDNVAGYVPMNATEKKEVQDDLKQYGLSWNLFQYVVTRQGLKWNPMSFNVKDLDTKGTIREGIDMICDRFSYPAELMSGKNATYENRSSSEKYLYQNVVIPSSMRDMRQFNNFFEVDTFQIGMCYDELPVLQADAVSQGEARRNNVQAYLLMFQNGVITLNQFRTLTGVENVKGDDIYYSEYLTKYKVPNGQTTSSTSLGVAA